MGKMIIMQGISGSGKSTHATGYAKILDAALCSADNYPGLYGNGIFNIKLLAKAHNRCKRDAIEAVTVGKNVVIDNTNTTALEMAFYVELGMTYGYQVEIVKVNAEIGEAYERNVHNVPRDVVELQQSRLNKFTVPEHWQFTKTIKFTEIN